MDLSNPPLASRDNESSTQKTAPTGITSLPAELLTKVFLEVKHQIWCNFCESADVYRATDRDLDLSPRFQPLAWIAPVTHVCHDWRQISLEFPRLWCHIYISRIPEHAAWAVEMLHRSQSMSLIVDVILYLFRTKIPLPWTALDLLRDNLWRCKVLRIFALPKKGLERFFSEGIDLGQLERLAIRPDYVYTTLGTDIDTRFRAIPRLATLPAPQLRRLCLDGWGIDLPNRYRTLTHFDFVVTRKEITAEDVLSFASQTPELEVLQVHCQELPEFEPLQRKRRRFDNPFPKIRRVVVNGFFISCIMALLQHLSTAPNLKYFKATVDFAPTRPEWFQELKDALKTMALSFSNGQGASDLGMVNHVQSARLHFVREWFGATLQVQTFHGDTGVSQRELLNPRLVPSAVFGTLWKYSPGQLNELFTAMSHNLVSLQMGHIDLDAANWFHVMEAAPNLESLLISGSTIQAFCTALLGAGVLLRTLTSLFVHDLKRDPKSTVSEVLEATSVVQAMTSTFSTRKRLGFLLNELVFVNCPLAALFTDAQWEGLASVITKVSVEDDLLQGKQLGSVLSHDPQPEDVCDSSFNFYSYRHTYD